MIRYSQTHLPAKAQNQLASEASLTPILSEIFLLERRTFSILQPIGTVSLAGILTAFVLLSHKTNYLPNLN